MVSQNYYIFLFYFNATVVKYPFDSIGNRRSDGDSKSISEDGDINMNAETSPGHQMNQSGFFIKSLN